MTRVGTILSPYASQTREPRLLAFHDLNRNETLWEKDLIIVSSFLSFGYGKRRLGVTARLRRSRRASFPVAPWVARVR